MRHASNRLSRLNLSEPELMDSILQPWVRGEKVELGERAWMPDEAQITIIEGPEVPIGGMTLGRGWPTAQRKGKDVTQEMLARAQKQVAETPRPAAELQLLADSLGLDLLRRLGDGEMSLQAAWRLAGERHRSLTPSSTLELVAAAIGSLVESDLLAVVRSGAEDAIVQKAELPAVLADVGSWSSGDVETSLKIRRL